MRKNGDVYSDLTDAEKVSSLQLKGPCYPVLIPSVNTYFSCNYYGNFSQSSFDALKGFDGFEYLRTDFLTDSTYSSFSSLDGLVETINSEVTDYIAGPMERFQRYIDDFIVAKNVLGMAARLPRVIARMVAHFEILHLTLLLGHGYRGQPRVNCGDMLFGHVFWINR